MVERITRTPKPRPRFIEPMECKRVPKLPEGDLWLYGTETGRIPRYCRDRRQCLYSLLHARPELQGQVSEHQT